MLKENNLKTNNLIEKRLKEFIKLHNSENKFWFSELCFCILTANARAKTAIAIQEEITADGFLNLSEDQVKNVIKKYGHRFYNNKARYIVEARKFSNIKEIITKFESNKDARDFLVKNIKGLGYKEASHFLRNVGYHDVAIIDRHILRFMLNEKLIGQIPKVINKKKYLEYENILASFNIPLDKLDLIIWQKMTGLVLK